MYANAAEYVTRTAIIEGYLVVYKPSSLGIGDVDLTLMLVRELRQLREFMDSSAIAEILAHLSKKSLYDHYTAVWEAKNLFTTTIPHAQYLVKEEMLKTLKWGEALTRAQARRMVRAAMDSVNEPMWEKFCTDKGYVHMYGCNVFPNGRKSQKRILDETVMVFS